MVKLRKASYVVKKYVNRKLYDLQKSCYVTCENHDIFTNPHLKVVNHDGNDITHYVLAECIVQAVRNNNSIAKKYIALLTKNLKGRKSL